MMCPASNPKAPIYTCWQRIPGITDPQEIRRCQQCPHGRALIASVTWQSEADYDVPDQVDAPREDNIMDKQTYTVAELSRLIGISTMYNIQCKKCQKAPNARVKVGGRAGGNAPARYYMGSGCTRSQRWRAKGRWSTHARGWAGGDGWQHHRRRRFADCCGDTEDARCRAYCHARSHVRKMAARGADQSGQGQAARPHVHHDQRLGGDGATIPGAIQNFGKNPQAAAAFAFR